jgi:hypothetical protein
MAATKMLLDEIANCDNCKGAGITNEWANETDFDFEWCECNPKRLIPEMRWL